MPTNPYEPPQEEDEITTWGVLRLIGITLAIMLAFYAVGFLLLYFRPPASD
jgi:hypothetical protein